jgi:hypothetical protein
MKKEQLSSKFCVTSIIQILSPNSQWVSPQTRVARWYIFIPEIPIWKYFEGPLIAKCWYNLWPFVIWNILCPLSYFVVMGYISPVLVYCEKKNLATLPQILTPQPKRKEHSDALLITGSNVANL